MFAQGRPAKSPSIDNVRAISREDLAGLKRDTYDCSIKKFKDSHHMIARLYAMGLRSREVAARSGYSLNRVSTLQGSPAFQELVASYRADVDQSWRESADEYFENITAVRVTAARLLRDKLESADPDEVSLRELVAVHADTADRTGYPKRTVAVNVNVDFAARLDQAIKRSGQVMPLRVVGELPSHVPSGPIEGPGIIQDREPTARAPVTIEGEIVRRRA